MYIFFYLGAGRDDAKATRFGNEGAAAAETPNPPKAPASYLSIAAPSRSQHSEPPSVAFSCRRNTFGHVCGRPDEFRIAGPRDCLARELPQCSRSPLPKGVGEPQGLGHLDLLFRISCLDLQILVVSLHSNSPLDSIFSTSFWGNPGIHPHSRPFGSVRAKFPYHHSVSISG